MKMAEFLNLETKQVQWLDASLEHPNLVRVPEGAEIAIKFNYDPEGHGIIFYKNDGKTSAAADNGFLWKSGSLWSMKDLLDPYFKDCDINLSHVVLWQRNPLQEKINETLSVLNVNKAQLSLILGREKSYVKRLLAKNRNVTEKTKATVIDQLDQLIRVHEQDQGLENSKCIKELTVTLSIDTKEVQDELKKSYSLIDQANQNAEMYRQMCNARANLIKWMGGLIALLLILGIAMVAL